MSDLSTAASGTDTPATTQDPQAGTRDQGPDTSTTATTATSQDPAAPAIPQNQQTKSLLTQDPEADDSDPDAPRTTAPAEYADFTLPAAKHGAFFFSQLHGSSCKRLPRFAGGKLCRSCRVDEWSRRRPGCR